MSFHAKGGDSIIFHLCVFVFGHLLFGCSYYGFFLKPETMGIDHFLGLSPLSAAISGPRSTTRLGRPIASMAIIKTISI